MISVGTKVSILSCSEYGGRFSGAVGIVCRNYTDKNKIGVKFDSARNPNSNDGLFWFHSDNVAVMPVYYNDFFRATPNVKRRSWCYPDMSGNEMIERVIFSGSKTIVLWTDGTKTIVSCGEGDAFDPYAGFCAAVTKKVFGSTSQAKKVMEKYGNNHTTEASRLDDVAVGFMELNKKCIEAVRNFRTSMFEKEKEHHD